VPLVRAVHWLIGRSPDKCAKVAVLVLTRASDLQKIWQAHEDCSELKEVLEWAHAQLAKLPAQKNRFESDELAEWLRDPAHLVKTFDVPDDPPAVAFDIRDWCGWIHWTLASIFVEEAMDFRLPQDPFGLPQPPQPTK